MNNTVYIILIIALVLTLVGGMIFTIAFAAADWDFSKLDSGQYSTNTYSFSDSISDITICVSDADVNILQSSDNSTRVVCYEKNKLKHGVTAEDGNLRIDMLGAPKWYDSIISFSNPKIDIYLPEDNFYRMTITTDTGDVKVCEGLSFDIALICGDTSDISFAGAVKGQLKIEVSTGDVEIEDANAGDVEIKVSTGDVDIDNLSCSSLKTVGNTGDIGIENLTASGAVEIKRSTGDVAINIATVDTINVETDSGDITLGNITCVNELGMTVSTGDVRVSDSTVGSFVSAGDTGDINMSNLIVDGTMTIERDTGDVKITMCDAGEVYITTDTGNVVGSFLSDKIIFASSNTGKIDVPKITKGGKCEITTNTGKIIIDIAE